MRDPSRIDEMLDVLGQVWKAHPDLRLGQLVNTAGFLRACATCSNLCRLVRS
jgi:uncharacterized protein YihD (DUF1040 family)